MSRRAAYTSPLLGAIDETVWISNSSLPGQGKIHNAYFHMYISQNPLNPLSVTPNVSVWNKRAKSVVFMIHSDSITTAQDTVHLICLFIPSQCSICNIVYIVYAVAL